MGFADNNFHTRVTKRSQVGNQPDFFLDLDFVNSGQRFLANTDSGIVYADHTILEHAQTILGFTLHAGDTRVGVLVDGVYKDSSMSWDPALPLWLAEDGQMTQIRPTTGFIAQVGRVISPTEIIIEIQPSVILV